MKLLIVLVALASSALAAEEFCYKNVVQACKAPPNKQSPPDLGNCNAKYGAIDKVEFDLQAFANSHIERSFEYLLMSTHYGNYEKSREGFEKLFRDLSDSKWKSAIDIIKHITKRGGQMNFNIRKPDLVNGEKGNYELYELESLAKALDVEKQLAKEAHFIHGEATRRHAEHHDPEISSYIEEEFVEEHANNIRKLSGYTTDLTSLLSSGDSSLALYLFDEYLKKGII